MKRFLFVSALLAAWMGSAEAAVTATPAIMVGGNEVVSCVINNVGSKDVRIDLFELIDFAGKPRKDREERVLPANRNLILELSMSAASISGTNPWFCRVVIGGSSRSVRLSVCSGLEGGPACASSATAP